MNPLFAPVPQPWANILISLSIGMILAVIIMECYRAYKEGVEDIGVWAARYPRKAKIYLAVFALLFLLLFLSDPDMHALVTRNITPVGEYRIGNMSLNEASSIIAQSHSQFLNLSVIS